MVSFLVLLFSFNQLLAGPHFTALRDDQSVPEHCQEMELSFYHLPIEKFYLGRKGGVEMGFTFEYPVTRSNATILWKYFKPGGGDSSLLYKIKNNKELLRDYEIIVRNYEKQDFDFASEGEILEILGIEQLYEIYPKDTYYITGSVEYHKIDSPMTIGELDFYVGNRIDCSSVAIGEAKLGTRKTLNKARKQLQRFYNFLVDHNVDRFIDGDFLQPEVVCPLEYKQAN